MATTHQNDLRALEQTRQRLQQLTNALGSLQREIAMSDPLPNWTNLTTSFALLSHQLASLTSHVSSNASTLSALHAYPLPVPSPTAHAQGANGVSAAGPGVPVWRPQEGLLTQLLRKKLDPETETWIQAGADASSIAQTLDGSTSTESAPRGIDAAKLDNTWTNAAGKAREIFAQIPWNSNFTISEREGEGGVKAVNTSLKRDLAADEESEDEEDDEDDDEDEDEDESKEEDSGKMDVDEKEASEKRAIPRVPMMPLEDILRFASTGMFVQRRPMTAAAGGRP